MLEIRYKKKAARPIFICEYEVSRGQRQAHSLISQRQKLNQYLQMHELCIERSLRPYTVPIDLFKVDRGIPVQSST